MKDFEAELRTRVQRAKSVLRTRRRQAMTCSECGYGSRDWHDDPEWFVRGSSVPGKSGSFYRCRQCGSEWRWRKFKQVDVIEIAVRLHEASIWS